MPRRPRSRARQPWSVKGFLRASPKGALQSLGAAARAEPGSQTRASLNQTPCVHRGAGVGHGRAGPDGQTAAWTLGCSRADAVHLSGGQAWREAPSGYFLQHRDVAPIVRNLCVPKRAVWLRRACQEPGRPQAEGAVLTCSPGLSAVENHWDTGWPLPNSSIRDVSGLIFAPLPFSGKETQGSGEFALLSFPLAFSLLTNGLNVVPCSRSWCHPKGGDATGATARPMPCSAPESRGGSD